MSSITSGWRGQQQSQSHMQLQKKVMYTKTARVKKRYKIKGGDQEMAVMVVQWKIFTIDNSGEFGAKSFTWSIVTKILPRNYCIITAISWLSTLISQPVILWQHTFPQLGCFCKNKTQNTKFCKLTYLSMPWCRLPISWI